MSCLPKELSFPCSFPCALEPFAILHFADNLLHNLHSRHRLPAKQS